MERQGRREQQGNGKLTQRIHKKKWSGEVNPEREFP
jgi:hypothetical protein